MSGTIRRLLVANRGEIAVRILRSARAMGIETVAVFSDADADAMHVQEADMAIHIGGSAASESYLKIEKLIDACRQSGADALHPGYGFLSENAAFAAACEAADIQFVGPTAAAIAQMGSKRAAKALAVKAGVPVVPGYYGEKQDDATLLAEANKIGFPVLFKASAGGGGRGMRLVRDPAEAASAIQDARSESQRAFGDDVLLVEKYIDRPRHIEIQILADHHGHVIHLGERECSIQRRHQKVLEESPSPFVDDALRAKMGEAAVQLAKQIGYRNAGTVEFIVDEAGEFYFLEMNTRLQVEHPVTELVTGKDLVRAQLEIASGRALTWTQDAIALEGAAIEARIYAEDPANDFLPASGTLWRWRVEEDPAIRVDTGVREGDEVSVHYDPMLAKIIAYAPTRAEASRALERALRTMQVAGVQTNREFLLDLLATPDWRSGDTQTHLIEEHFPDGWTPAADEALCAEAALAVSIWDYNQRMKQRQYLPSLVGTFRNSRLEPAKQHYLHRGDALEIGYIPVGRRFMPDKGELDVALQGGVVGAQSGGIQSGGVQSGGVQSGGAQSSGVQGAGAKAPQASADASKDGKQDASQNGELQRWSYRVDGDTVRLRSPSGLMRPWSIAARQGQLEETALEETQYLVTSLAGAFELQRAARFPSQVEEERPGSCTAPMTGTVLRVYVEEGETVTAGQTLIVLEAMKMEHRVSAPEDGVVTSLTVEEGDLVDSGVVLAIVDPS